MKELEINQKVIQLLNDFEKLEPIDASDEWNQVLMQKLTESKNPSPVVSFMPYAAAIVLMLVLNVVCAVHIFKNTHQPSFNRIAKLNIISKELLIPNVSLNN
jgi:hypothetical protein